VRSAHTLMLGWTLLLAACSTNRLEDEWAVTLEGMEGQPLAVVDMLPSSGTVGISQEFSPYVLLSRPLTPTESVTLDLSDGAGGPVSATPRRDPDDLAVRFEAGVLDRDTSFAGQVVLAGVPDRPLGFSTFAPTGPAFNMSAGLEVEAFGAGTGQLGLVNELFEPGLFPLWTLQVEGTTAPPTLSGTVDFVFAPSRLDEVSPQYVVHVEWGFVSVIPEVSFDGGGGFSQALDTLFLPLWSSDGVFLLHMTDVAFDGQVSMGGDVLSVNSVTLSGVLGTRSLLLLADASDGWRAAIGAARPDVDTNGNGVPDSVTFTFSATPTPISLAEIDL
jgi:hypothetical protein